MKPNTCTFYNIAYNNREWINKDYMDMCDSSMYVKVD